MNIDQILRAEPGTDRKILQQKYLGMLENYRMVADFAESPEVRAIAQSKLEQLREAGSQAGLSEKQEDGRLYDAMNLTSIRLALNSSHSDERQLEAIETRLYGVPETAESHYLKAAVRLKMHGDMSDYSYVVNNLNRSLELDPNYKASRVLLDAVQEQQRQREEAVRQRLEQKEAERQAQERLRQEQERQQQDELQRQKQKEMLDSAGETAGTCCYCCCACCGDLICESCDC